MSDTKRKIVCHAEGDRCFGCAHYLGKADECEFKGLEQGITISRECAERIKTLLNGYVLSEPDKEYKFEEFRQQIIGVYKKDLAEIEAALGQHTGEQP